jgi:hypothetical protein
MWPPVPGGGGGGYLPSQTLSTNHSVFDEQGRALTHNISRVVLLPPLRNCLTLQQQNIFIVLKMFLFNWFDPEVFLYFVFRNAAIHRFKKAYDSVRREVIYCIQRTLATVQFQSFVFPPVVNERKG